MIHMIWDQVLKSGKIYSYQTNAGIGSLHVAGVSTYVGVATFQDNVFVDGTLTAGLIDGGSF